MAKRVRTLVPYDPDYVAEDILFHMRIYGKSYKEYQQCKYCTLIIKTTELNEYEKTSTRYTDKYGWCPDCQMCKDCMTSLKNPKTGRKIKVPGDTYWKLVKENIVTHCEH